MPTSHYCNGKWRDGPVADCPRHQKLSKKLSKVYGGIGEPGGASATEAPKGGGSDGGSSQAGSSESGSSPASSSTPTPSTGPAPGSKES